MAAPTPSPSAVAHRENGIGVLDVLREARAPFKPSVVVEEFAAILRDYGITTVYGDNYAKEWPIEAFALHGIKYVRYDKFKNEIYLTALPLINSRQVRLLDITRYDQSRRSTSSATPRAADATRSRTPIARMTICRTLRSAPCCWRRSKTKQLVYGRELDGSGPPPATGREFERELRQGRAPRAFGGSTVDELRKRDQADRGDRMMSDTMMSAMSDIAAGAIVTCPRRAPVVIVVRCPEAPLPRYES